MVAEKRTIGRYGNCSMFLARSKREDGPTAHPDRIARSVAPGLCPSALSRFLRFYCAGELGEMKSEMSRSRPRSEQRRRNFVIRVRVDAFELDLIRELAASMAVSVSSYVRDAALKRVIKGNTTPSRAKLVSDLASVVGNLKRLGNRTKDTEQQRDVKYIVDSVAAVADSIARGAV